MRSPTYDQRFRYSVRHLGPLDNQHAFVTSLAILEILGTVDRMNILCYIRSYD
jgi:hypothetical protein